MEWREGEWRGLQVSGGQDREGQVSGGKGRQVEPRADESRAVEGLERAVRNVILSQSSFRKDKGRVREE
eukprot:356940-Chlamydomonas_euryale.AAC.8